MSPLDLLLALFQTPAPPPTGGPGVYVSSWETHPAGVEPAEWRDVSSGAPRYPWLYAGDWAIARPPGEAPHYAVSAYTGDHPEPLTFRRFAGSVFGPDGVLPKRFRFDAVARSTGGSRRFGGVGELAVQALYVDPTHYLEIMQVDTHFKVWWADGAEPQQSKGWRLLGQWARPYRIGEWLTFGADVDLDGGKLGVWIDGRKAGEVDIPAAMRKVSPRLTIRATGNGEEWRSIAIRSTGD